MEKFIIKYIRIKLILIALLILASCDSGLKPQPENTSYVYGKIKYVNSTDNWPPIDSLKDLRVVAFKHFPPDNLIQEVLSGQAYYTNSTLPFFVDSTNFVLEIKDAPVELKYIAVAQQFGGIIDWLVVGIYSDNNDSAKHLFVEKGKVYHIQINVDFKNLPKQPF
jgi:hypothetical protein